MSFIQSIAAEAIRAITGILTGLLSRPDHRTVVLERRAKALQLFKELRAAGLRPRDLKAIEGTLTDED
jgi:hypothetical protein